MTQKPTMIDCLVVAANNQELVSHFDRLTGYNLSRRGSQLDLTIDDATGRTTAASEAFIAFVRECVFDRLPS